MPVMSLSTLATPDRRAAFTTRGVNASALKRSVDMSSEEAHPLVTARVPAAASAARRRRLDRAHEREQSVLELLRRRELDHLAAIDGGGGRSHHARKLWWRRLRPRGAPRASCVCVLAGTKRHFSSHVQDLRCRTDMRRHFLPPAMPLSPAARSSLRRVNLSQRTDDVDVKIRMDLSNFRRKPRHAVPAAPA